MRLAIWITGFALLAPTVAQAQGFVGSCSGSQLAGTVGLAIADGSGNIDDISAAVLPFVFDAAECTCPNQDLQLDISLISALPAGSIGTAELWAGSGCDTNSTARTTPGATVCEKLATIDFSQFVVGGVPSSHIYLPISTLPLFAPVTHQCPTVNQSNGLYVLLFSGASSSPSGPPAASCALQLEETVVAPDAPVDLTATPAQGGVVLAWSPASLTSAPVSYYQVLCDDGNDQPIASEPPAPVYSVCTASGIERRILPLGGGTGSASLPSVTLASLDNAFVCSPPMIPGSGTSSVLINGLTAGKSYRFVVLAVDAAGNATPSAELTAGPLAAQPNLSSHGCSYAGGRSATTPAALLLLCAALVLLLRRRASMA
jgi:hypothetical protein